MAGLDFETLPRLLFELCDGHPARGQTVYAFMLPNGVRQWLCSRCYEQAWRAAGCPPQEQRGRVP